MSSIPTPQFKYLQKEYAHKMVEDGTIRIGTLFDFRRYEEYGSEVGDESEGTSTVYSNDTVEWGDFNEAPELYKRLFPGRPNYIKFEGIEIRQAYKLPDAYVYCTSLEFSDNIMESFNCDACVRIDDMESFIKTISRTMKDDIKICLARKCLYAERRIHHLEPSRPHPGFLKDPGYSYQKEFRTVWVPNSLPIEPFIIIIPEITPFCTMHSSGEPPTA